MRQKVFSINDAVRILFSIIGIVVFVYFGSDTKQNCESMLLGIKTNSTQIFGVILIALGLGAPMLMKYLSNKKMDKQ